MSDRLSDRSLPALPASVFRPGYDRSLVTPGIVHLGVGAFHRAHQASYVDDCIAAGESDWGIVGASLQSASTAEALEPQDGLYTLAVRGGADRGAACHRLDRPDAGRTARSPGIARRADRPAYPHRHADDHREGLSPERIGRSRPDASRHRCRPCRSRPSPHGARFPASRRWRAAGPPARSPSPYCRCDNLPSNGATLHRLLTAIRGAAGRDAGRSRRIRVAARPA